MSLLLIGCSLGRDDANKIKNAENYSKFFDSDFIEKYEVDEFGDYTF